MKKFLKPTSALGFTTIELLVTLFIAAIFLVSGFQLYVAIIKDGGEVRAQMRASNIAYDYMQRYKPSATTPCTTQSLLVDQPIAVSGLSNTIVSVYITCPFSASTSVSKIYVTVLYNNPQKTVSNATYVKL